MKLTLLRLACAVGYGCATTGLWTLVTSDASPLYALTGVHLVGTLLVGLMIFFALAQLSPVALRNAGRFLALVVLPLWGLVINHRLRDCYGDCDKDDLYRLLAEPEVYGFFVAYAVTALAYAIARVRTEALPALGELLLLGTLLAGVMLMAMLLLQFSSRLLLGLLFAPAGLPLIAPLLVVGLYCREIWQRLRRRGHERGAQPAVLGMAALATAPALVGLAAVLQSAWTARCAQTVFTQTCQTPLGQLVPPVCSGHYLCTIAAQGHPALVRPLRLGRRHGQPIVVNRQLAVANAFEDLLRERWPRLQRVSRAIYDRLAWPLSRYLRRRTLADAVYLLMKPAEWLFYLALLLLDPHPPELRIDQMYR